MGIVVVPQLTIDGPVALLLYGKQASLFIPVTTLLPFSMLVNTKTMARSHLKTLVYVHVCSQPAHICAKIKFCLYLVNHVPHCHLLLVAISH